jgi:uncharacterized protein (DUF433 family)
MTTAQSLIEADRMRRIPGIVFADGAAGRRARIAGTGIEVFEVIQQYLNVDRDWGQTQEAYHWLTPEQLSAAIAYYTAYPEEIDEWLTEARELEEAFLSSGPGPYFPPYPDAVQRLDEKWDARRRRRGLTF